MSNQRKHAPVFPLAATIIGIGIAVCVVSFFVKALLVRHQVVQDGERIKRLERQVAEVTAKNESLLAKKNELISVPALRLAMDRGFLKLQAIDERFVINVAQPRPAVAVTTGGEAR
jgi:hypothetical protein